MRQTIYFLRQAYANIRNNRLIHLIGMSTMAISILLLGAFVLLYINVHNWIQDWGGSTTMSIYLKDQIDEVTVAKIRSAIKEAPAILQLRYVSKDEALQELKKALGEQSNLLSALTDNPLPASFEVQIRLPHHREHSILEKLAEKFRGLDGVEEVQYSQAWIERFRSILDMVRVAGFLIGGLLGMGALFIVTNTIKLTIYSRKEEIEILKLVGATDWFVKAPFLAEGMIQGTISSVVAMGILYIGFIAFSAKKNLLLGFSIIEPKFIPWSYIGSIIGLSLVVGALGSLIAVGRFFDVARS